MFKWLKSRFKKQEYIAHFDYASNGDENEVLQGNVKGMEEKLSQHLSKHGTTLPEICCSRFEHAVKEGYIKYSYQFTDSIDETNWFVDDFFHLYFCPFCGTNIKGIGFGEYDINPEDREVLMHVAML